MSERSHITIILDRSGSMRSIRDDVIGGTNHYLAEQRATNDAATVTLVQFDGQDPYEVLQHYQPLASVADLTPVNYRPRGTTPLLDALGRAINDLDGWLAAQPDEQRPGKILFVIVTDGEENASREFSLAQVNELIRVRRDEQGWQFIYISSDLEAVKQAEQLGMRRSSSMAFDHSGQGLRGAFQSVSTRSSEYRRGLRGQAEFEQSDRRRVDDPNRDPLFAQSFSWPSVNGKRVLVVGIGGGSDVVAATALADRLQSAGAAEVIYGNAKRHAAAGMTMRSRFIGELPPTVVPLTPDSVLKGTCAIDAAMPRGAQGSPLIFLTPTSSDTAEFTAELAALNADLVVAVDTGGDVLMGAAGGRDWRMLQGLRGLGVPLLLAVVGPCSDGELSFTELRQNVVDAAGRGVYLGTSALNDVMPRYRELSAGLPPYRTPQIVLDALLSPADSLIAVPRGNWPRVPAGWLRTVLWFDGRSL
jgi:hypothetical protein